MADRHFSPEHTAKFHRAMHKLRTGGLHRALGIAEGEKIPMEKVEEATRSDNPHVRKMAVLAKAMHGWHHSQ